MIIDDVLKNIENGRNGLSKGLDIGLPRISNYIPGVQKGTIYLIGASSGVGKSNFALNTFLYNPYEDTLAQPEKGKLKVIYYSFEMAKDIIITKGICRKIYKDTGLLVDVNYILSRGKNRVSDEMFAIVRQYKDWFNKLEDECLDIITAENPTGISHYLTERAKLEGKTITKPMLINGITTEVFDRYVPNDPSIYTVVIIDHVSIMRRERGFTKKENIDKLCEYVIPLSNRYKYSFALVQQLNRDSASTDRMKLNQLEIRLEDFKESGDTTDAAHFVLGLFNPLKYEMTTYRGYNIARLKDRFRSLKIIKSREGAADIITGLTYYGEAQLFEEAPLPKISNGSTNPEIEGYYNMIENLKKYNNK